MGELTIINIEAPHGASEDAPAARLQKGPSVHRNGINPVIVPVDTGRKWVMFGGTFAHTSDSRLDEAVRALYSDFPGIEAVAFGAIAIHDRIES